MDALPTGTVEQMLPRQSGTWMAPEAVRAFVMPSVAVGGGGDVSTEMVDAVSRAPTTHTPFPPRSWQQGGSWRRGCEGLGGGGRRPADVVALSEGGLWKGFCR